ncbi:MAG: lysophospholipid acyltransferase family protein [Myxococcota bacterium]|nr:lysophospholipid acyltransferase family protein [Myxococcota bacterium]
MTMTPHIDPSHPSFPGDPLPQPPFGFRDTVRSALMWAVGLVELMGWSAVVNTVSNYVDVREIDFLLKWMSKAMPASLGIRVQVTGAHQLDPDRPYVYVANHVNIFDMFVLYQAIPQFSRGLELAEHFSWPIVGPLIRAAGQIPINQEDARENVKSLKRAAQMLKQGESITVLPEGSRTWDGSVGHFYPGAFRLAIGQRVPVVPMAIRGGRAVCRRGDWRFRPGREEVLIGTPVVTEGLRMSEASDLASTCRQIIIDMLHGRSTP